MTEPKYMLHPGWVISERDGQDHFVSARQLAWLYGVPFTECIVKPKGTDALGWNEPPNLIHLYPRHSGNYKLEGIK